MRLLATVVFAVLGVLLAPLSLAAFASINPSVSDALRLLSVGEGVLAAKLSLASLDAFWRGLLYLCLSCALIWLSAYLKPRA